MKRLALAVGLLLLFAPDARATSCANLQTALNDAAAGATVTVDPGVTCTLATTLTWNGKALTLAGSGSTLVAPAADNAIVVSDAGASVIRDLTIRGASTPAAEPGAIRVTGNSTPTFERLTLIANTAAGGAAADGGGISVDTTSPDGAVRVLDSDFGDGTAAGRNSANDGGALSVNTGSGVSVEIAGSEFRDNRSQGNGGAVRISGTSPSVVLTGNTFAGNAIDPGAAAEFHFGGAAYVTNFSGNPGTYTVTGNTVTGNTIIGGINTQSASGAGMGIFSTSPADVTMNSSANVFDGNSVTAVDQDASVSGGGLVTLGLTLRSVGDRFTDNALPSSTVESEGAGLSIDGCGSGTAPPSRLENAIVTGNSGAGPVEGTGVYIGCSSGPTTLEVRNSTITGNTAGSDTAGVWGGTDDTLVMVNSVAAGNTGGLDVAGFDAGRTITYSDACVGGAAAPGTGNLCVPPGLNPDASIPLSSPLIDKGDNAGVLAPLATDAFGGPRVLDGNADGVATVDIGADEIQGPAVTATPTPTASASPAPTVVPDTTAPSITLLKGSRTRVTFTVSEAASVRLVVARRTKGRKVKGKCVKKTRKNAKKRGCRRYVARVTKTALAAVGPTTVRLGRKLPRGRYRVTAVATDAAGNRSARSTASFRVRKT